jgi:hypothetical protein
MSVTSIRGRLDRYWPSVRPFSSTAYFGSGGSGMKRGIYRTAVAMPILDSVVGPDLRVFLAVLSHLPVAGQLELLQDATKQISEGLESMAR